MIKTSSDIAKGLSVIDKRAKAIEVLLKELDFNNFNKSEDETAFLNIHAVCNGYGSIWKEGGFISSSNFNIDLHKPRGIFKREITRSELPEGGFDLCIENLNSSWLSSGQDYQINVLAYISNKTQWSEFGRKCN